VNLEKAMAKIEELQMELERYKIIEETYMRLTGVVIPCGQKFDSSKHPVLSSSLEQELLPNHPINKPTPMLLPDMDGQFSKEKER
jgi:hypothetical protein